MQGAASGATAAQGNWAAFARVWLAAALCGLALGAGLTTFVDPLWVFRERPPWLGWTGGVNRLLDVEMRRAKPLQLAGRPAETVLVGSSVVYRGFELPEGREATAYNFGLSSLMADELLTAAGLIRSRPGVRRVVIGLDFFTFTDVAGPPRLNPDLATRAGLARAWIGAALSLRALAATFPPALASAYEGGAWRPTGHKTTPDYPAAVTAREAAAEAGRTLRYRPETIAHLETALRLLAGLDVRLHLSPVNAAQVRLANAAGRADGFAAWRRDVAAAAARAGIPFRDLSRDHPFDEFDPAAGSSRHWLDHLHFKPAVGAWVLDQIAAPARVPAGPAASGSRRPGIFPP